MTTAATDAREIAAGIEVEISWPETHRRISKRHFEYEGREQVQPTAEGLFETEFFLHLVDTALVTIRERFSHLEAFYELYKFLYAIETMSSTVQNGKLSECCNKLQQTTGVDAEDLKLEITRAVIAFPTPISSPSEMLDYIYRENILDVYSHLSIALRFLLTLPVMVASGERNFSSLKLIKTYLRTTMSQERLSALALLYIEQRVTKTLDMESVIARFAEAKARQVSF